MRTTLKLVLHCCCLLILAPRTRSAVNINGVNCSFNPKMMRNSYCNITNQRGKMWYFSSTGIMVRPLEDVDLQLRLLRKFGNNVARAILSVRQNICNYNELSAENYFLNRILAMCAKHIRRLKCPLQGNITLTKIPIMLYFSQGLIPPSNYILNSLIFRNEITVLEVNISFAIT